MVDNLLPWSHCMVGTDCDHCGDNTDTGRIYRCLFESSRLVQLCDGCVDKFGSLNVAKHVRNTESDCLNANTMFKHFPVRLRVKRSSGVVEEGWEIVSEGFPGLIMFDRRLHVRVETEKHHKYVLLRHLVSLNPDIPFPLKLNFQHDPLLSDENCEKWQKDWKSAFHFTKAHLLLLKHIPRKMVYMISKY